DAKKADADETLVPDPARVGAPAMPFDIYDASSVDGYAKLRADLMAWPEKGEAILKRFGVHERAAFDELQTRWRERFAADPALRDRWLELYTRLRGPRA